MQVARAKQIARDWISTEVESGSPIEAAFLHGSITWFERDSEIPPASDVDVLIIPGTGSELPVRGKQVVHGLALDVSTVERVDLEPASKLLATYHLAGSLRSSESILYDPTGWLSALQQTVEYEFERPEWVRLRCAHAISRIRENLARLEFAYTPEDRMLAWLFATGVSTHVLLVAGLRNPTVRNRYAAVRSMLTSLGHPEMYAALIDLLDPCRTDAGTVDELITGLEPLFDLAVRRSRTWFHFSEDLSPSGRIGAIDGSRDLVRSGHPRDALFWFGVTAARCMTVLRADGTDSDLRRFETYFADLASIYGIDRAGINDRVLVLNARLPLLERDAEILIAERSG